MTSHLYLGDYAYSSWSLRGWLLFEAFGLTVPTTVVDFQSQDVADQLSQLETARTVPTWITPEGAVVSDSLAIAEELATRHPGHPFWPKDPASRAFARSITAEMHSGFGALRSECPMNLRTAYSEMPISDALAADLARVDQLWTRALEAQKGDGPWLFGAYSIADVFFAPVAARIAGYALPVSDLARSYVMTHLQDSAFRRWRAMGLVHGATLPWYVKPYPVCDWPGPDVPQGETVATGPSVNANCPYSGGAVSHFMQFDGQVWGFCNAFCRDKTAADPTVWPKFMAMRDELG